MKKLYDLAVKTGTYTQNGETKGRYENVGAMMEGSDGPFVMMKRTFNPAGVPHKDGSDAILVSMFQPKAKDGQQAAPKAASKPAADFPDDDIGF